MHFWLQDNLIPEFGIGSKLESDYMKDQQKQIPNCPNPLELFRKRYSLFILVTFPL